MKTCIDIAEEHKISLHQDANGWYAGICPRHEDTQPSLRIEPDGEYWVCMGCHKGGDAIEMVRWLTGASFRDALAFVSDGERTHQAWMDRITAPRPSPRSSPSLFVALMRTGVLTHEDADEILAAENPEETLEILLDRKLGIQYNG